MKYLKDSSFISSF